MLYQHLVRTHTAADALSPCYLKTKEGGFYLVCWPSTHVIQTVQLYDKYKYKYVTSRNCTNSRIILKLLSVAVRKFNNTFSPQFGRENGNHTDHPFRCNQFRGELMCVSIMHETLLAFIALLSQILD